MYPGIKAAKSKGGDKNGQTKGINSSSSCGSDTPCCNMCYCTFFDIQYTIVYSKDGTGK